MKKTLLIIPATLVILVLAYLTYDFLKTSACDTIFQQTAVSLRSKLKVITQEGEIFIGRQKLQDLSERSQNLALTLKTCCILRDTGNATAEEFLTCKGTAEQYEKHIEKVVIHIDEAQLAKQQGKADLVNEQVSQIDATLYLAEANSKRFREQVTQLSGRAPASETKKGSSKAGSEQEPNNTAVEANRFPMGITVSGEISSGEDKDYFKITNTSSVRDSVKVSFSNLSATLAPWVVVYDQNKSQMLDRYNKTPGANLEFSFIAEPGKDYYFRINYYGAGGGEYKLSVKPQQSYDEYEPNDTALSSTLLKTGQPRVANILDEKDVDWYKVTGITEKKITVLFDNLSATLAPWVVVYDQNKSQMLDRYNKTPGANLEFSFIAEPGKDYYFRINYYGAGGGEYKLLVSQGKE